MTRFASLVLFAAVASCSPSSNPDPTPADTGGETEAGCMAFDAGPPAPDSAPPKDVDPDEDGGVADSAPPDTGPVVTRAEIDTIFERACSFSSCHGRPPGSGKLYLPPRATSNWWPEVVNKPSVLHKTMKRIVPGDPQNSFLVHKLTDGLCALDKDCVDGHCGDRMPQAPRNSPDPLPKDELQKIIDWIRAGASEK